MRSVVLRLLWRLVGKSLRRSSSLDPSVLVFDRLDLCRRCGLLIGVVIGIVVLIVNVIAIGRLGGYCVPSRCMQVCCMRL